MKIAKLKKYEIVIIKDYEECPELNGKEAFIIQIVQGANPRPPRDPRYHVCIYGTINNNSIFMIEEQYLHSLGKFHTPLQQFQQQEGMWEVVRILENPYYPDYAGKLGVIKHVPIFEKHTSRESDIQYEIELDYPDCEKLEEIRLAQPYLEKTGQFVKPLP